MGNNSKSYPLLSKPSMTKKEKTIFKINNIIMITEETITALKLVEEKEPPISKECFQEYRKGNKTLKTIAKEKQLKYTTIKHYSNYYKYKARKEILYNNTTTPTTPKNKQAKQYEHSKHHTKIKNINTDNYTPLKPIEATNIISPVGVPPKEDETITKIIPPTNEGIIKEGNMFHEYTYKTEVELTLFLTPTEKKKLLTESKKHSYLTLEDFLTHELKEVTLTIDNLIKNSKSSKPCYNKQEHTLKLHDLNRYKPKLFSKSNHIRNSKQLTLDEVFILS